MTTTNPDMIETTVEGFQLRDGDWLRASVIVWLDGQAPDVEVIEAHRIPPGEYADAYSMNADEVREIEADLAFCGTARAQARQHLGIAAPALREAA